MTQQVEQIIKNNLPEFEVKVYGTNDLKSFFALANCLTERLTIHVVKEEFGEGFIFRTMDPSHIALLDVLWDSSNFEKWNVSKPGSFAIETEQFYKLVKCFDKKDTITMSIKNEMLVFQTKTSTEKLRLVEPYEITTDCPLPKITYDATITTSQKAIKDIIKRIDLVAEHVEINMHGQVMEFSGKGDKGEANLKLEKGMPDIPEFYLREDSTSRFNVEYIKEFLKCLDGSMITTEFSTRMPLRMSTKFSNGSRIHFYLAPRVES